MNWIERALLILIPLAAIVVWIIWKLRKMEIQRDWDIRMGNIQPRPRAEYQCPCETCVRNRIRENPGRELLDRYNQSYYDRQAKH